MLGIIAVLSRTTHSGVLQQRLFSCVLALSAVTSGVALSAAANAQEVRGTVLSADNATPASGVVMVLVHATRNDSIIARTVTNERGAYSLKAPAAMNVRLRALRIGFQPVEVGAVVLFVGPPRTVNVTLHNQQIALATMAITTSKRCALRPEGSDLVAKLFVEARTALLATGPVYGRDTRTQTIEFIRYEDLHNRLRSPIERASTTHAAWQAYISAPIDSLSKNGYVVQLNDGTVYYAPDANVLLSDAFAAQHCLQLVNGTGERAGSVGIGFRPVNRPHTIVDIAGTLWLDRQSYELQDLEFTYDTLPRELQRAHVGGRVEYTRLSDGTWVINRWSIRKPIIYAQQRSVREAIVLGKSSDSTVIGLEINGGELQSVRVGGNVLYSSSSAALAGAARDDIMGTAVVTAGSYVADPVAQARTSVMCDGARVDYTGNVHGKVTTISRQPVVAARVSAAWQEQFRVSGKNDVSWQTRELRTESAVNGGYNICDLPVTNPVTMSATKNRVKSYPAKVLLSAASPSAELDFALDISPEAAVSPATDTVAHDAAARSSADVELTPAGPSNNPRSAQVEILDPAGAPVTRASLTLNGASSQATDAHGVLTLRNMSDNSITVIVRRTGFESFQGTVTRVSNTQPFRITMSPVAQNPGRSRDR